MISRIAATAAKYGIYTLLDMHQDDLAEAFCGEGLPAWAVDTTGAWSFLPFPMGISDLTAGFNASQYENASIPGYAIPTRQACAMYDWGSQIQFANALGAAYEQLYTSPRLLTAWSNMWAVRVR